VQGGVLGDVDTGRAGERDPLALVHDAAHA